MIDVIMWLMILFSFGGTLVSLFLSFTLLRAFMRLMDRVDTTDDVLTTKVDRPQPPPNTIPLEKM